MPGILDNIGNFFGGIGASMNPAIQENQFRQRAYNALANQNGPDDAAIMMGNLPAYGLGFQRQLFVQQLQDYANKHPGADLNEAMYALSLKGAADIYGPPPVVGGFEMNGYRSPGLLQHGPNGWTLQPPQGFGQPAPIAGVQEQPSQQPAAGGQNSALPPIANQMLDYERQQAAAKELGQHQGESASTVDSATDEVDRSLKLIDELAQHPGMRWATGIWANIPGGPPKGTDAYNFTKGVAQLKDKLTLNLMPTLQKMRTSPAVLEFLQKATGGQELDLGSNNFPKNLQDTRDALVQIRAAIQKQANVPVTQAPQAEGGPQTFNSQSELRAAIKAGKIKVGEPFRTGDGRTLLAQ